MKQAVVYGIPNCDTVKKAIDWLKLNEVECVFHNYKKEGISKEKLTAWFELVGWETVMNRRSSSWRALTAKEQSSVHGPVDALKLMLANNSIIKRPIIEYKKQLLIGFDEVQYQKLFS
ncbi:MAG: Spx/MgsR family RNA polymerase-binding regulatory protein [Chitinophagaceae bacterium]